jgi:HK97 gp10 family phage protein
MARVNIRANQGVWSLDGVKELKDALAALGDEVSTKIGRTSNRRSAQDFAATLKAAMPHRPGVQLKYYKGHGRDYGDLRDNVRVRLARARKEHTITYNVDTGDAFWSYFLEFGTVNLAAKPFMRPAFDSAASALIDMQSHELRGGIDRATRRLAAKQRRAAKR